MMIIEENTLDTRAESIFQSHVWETSQNFGSFLNMISSTKIIDTQWETPDLDFVNISVQLPINEQYVPVLVFSENQSNDFSSEVNSENKNFRFRFCSETNDQYSIETNNKVSVVNNFLRIIEESEKQGRKLLATKEAHKLIEFFISISFFDIVDIILELAVKKNFSLEVLIAFLSSTLAFKDKLKNRDLLFDKALDIAEKQLGQETIRKSIFSNLK